MIETLVLQTLYLLRRRDNNSAMTTLERALTLAEPEGYVRVFVNEGESMARLLKQSAASGITPLYAGRLLASYSSSVGSNTHPLPDPLSERELEVLHLIAAGLTNREIAEELVVSLGTIKSHVNHVYRKLDVHSRTQAIVRARELHLA